MAFRPVRFDSVGSTNDIALEAAEAGAAPGLVIVAHEQVHGKGRRTRDWSSPRGGLWTSVVLDPAIAPGLEGLVPLGVGTACAQALDRLGVPARLRWPNDLMLEDAKLGGILVESRVDGERLRVVVAGVGINVANDAPVEGAATLKGHEPALTVDAVLATVLDELGPVQQELCAGDAKRICERFMRRAWGIDRPMLLDGEDVIPREIAIDGALIVEDADGEIAIHRSGSLRLPPGR